MALVSLGEGTFAEAKAFDAVNNGFAVAKAFTAANNGFVVANTF